MLCALALLAATATGPACDPAVAAPPPPLPPAREFVRRIDDPWFPLEPGTVLAYRGEDEGVPATDVVRVTRGTHEILGVRATVIRDRVREGGRLVERTADWYAQDRAGNVWYLGERTATLGRDGRVKSTEGSWRAGRRGARAGIFLPARPRAGDGGWQEYDEGRAQDRYRVLDLHARVRTPAVASRRAMLVRETTPLEPGVVDHKLYVRGIGAVLERTVRGGDERFALVAVRRPRQSARRSATARRSASSSRAAASRASATAPDTGVTTSR
jgi:hypothetical protein